MRECGSRVELHAAGDRDLREDTGVLGFELWAVIGAEVHVEALTATVQRVTTACPLGLWSR